MRPNCTPAFIAGLQSPNIYPAYLVSLQLRSGVERFWTGYQQISYDGQWYKPTKGNLSISTIENGSDVTARGCSLTLGGIDPTLIAEALTEMQVGLDATIYLGLLSIAGGLPVLIPDPVVAFDGRTDQPTISIEAETATISLALETVLLDGNVPVPWRYTNQDQVRFYPGDLGFMWVNSIQSIPIFWDQATTSSGNP